MIRLVFIILIFCSLLTGSCTNRRKKLDHKNMIPERELPALLADLYISDGLLNLPSIRDMYSNLDSLSGYYQVVEKHGYTKEAMEKTMKYYFMKKPKQLIRIYDRALGILTRMESLVEKDFKSIQAHLDNKWEGRDFFYLPDPDGSDSAQIDITLENPGRYTLKFRARFYPGDELSPAVMNAYTCHRDSTETGKRKYISSDSYIKDGQPHYYTVRIVVLNNQPLRLRGYFYDPSMNPWPGEKNAVIDNISMSYIFAVE